MNLVLIGVRGSGKSSVGAQLAQRLDLRFIDLDQEIASRAGRSVAEIFTGEGGEPEFRRLESAALEGLGGIDATVLATGGGVVLASASCEALRGLGPVVWLAVSPEESVRRMADAPRPPLTALSPLDEARQVAEQRRPLYEAMADRTVDTENKSLQEVCDELEQLWHDLSRHHIR